MISRPQVVVFYSGATRQFGGMETLVTRLSHYFHILGCDYVYLTGGLHPLQTFHPAAKVSVLGAEYFKLNTVAKLRKVMHSAGCNNVKAVIAMDLFSIRFAPLSRFIYRNIESVFASIWIPNYREWFTTGWLQYLNRLIFCQCYTPTTRLVMLKEYIRDLEALLGPRCACYWFPVPIEVGSADIVKADQESGRCVVVSRLEDIKTFVLVLPDVARRLALEGFNMHFEVIGDGPYKEQLREAIVRQRVQHLFSLKAPVANSELPQIFNGAFCAIGMGTVALESGACGIPTIIAMPSCFDGESCGFLYDSYDCEGPRHVATPEESSIYEMLKVLLVSDARKYADIAGACAAAASQMHFGNVLPHIISARENKVNVLKMWGLRVALAALGMVRSIKRGAIYAENTYQ